MQTFTASEAKTGVGKLLDSDLQGSSRPQAMSHQVMP